MSRFPAFLLRRYTAEPGRPGLACIASPSTHASSSPLLFRVAHICILQISSSWVTRILHCMEGIMGDRLDLRDCVALRCREFCRDLHFPFSAVVGEDPFYILITLFDCLLWSEGARWLLCWVGARLIVFIYMLVRWWSCRYSLGDWMCVVD